jgi:hypothetical protein
MNGPDYFEETRLMIHHYARIALAIAIIDRCLPGFVAVIATGGSSGKAIGRYRPMSNLARMTLV